LKRVKLVVEKGVKMTLQQITIEIPDKVLLAEKTDAESFGREIRMLAAVKLFEMGGFHLDAPPNLQVCPELNSC